MMASESCISVDTHTHKTQHTHSILNHCYAFGTNILFSFASASLLFVFSILKQNKQQHIVFRNDFSVCIFLWLHFGIFLYESLSFFDLFIYARYIYDMLCSMISRTEHQIYVYECFSLYLPYFITLFPSECTECDIELHGIIRAVRYNEINSKTDGNRPKIEQRIFNVIARIITNSQ